MKWIWISLAIVVILLVATGYWLKTLWSKIDFDFKVTNIGIAQLLKGKISLTLDLIIKNQNKTEISISSLYLELYYKGVLIAKTPKVIAKNIIKAESDTTIKNFYLDLYLNKASAEVTKKYIAKEPIDLDIKIGARLFGFPIPKTTVPTFTYQPE